MTIRTNKIMDKYLSKIGYNFWETSLSLPVGLEKIVQSEFITDNDCIILKSVAQIETNPKFDTNLEKCEFEDFENHFHPDSYIETNNEIDYLKLALECGKRLAKRIDSELKTDNFRVGISFSETTVENGEIEFYGSSTVRFYKVREDCEEIMRTSNLDDFESEAVLEIEKLQKTENEKQ